MCIKAYKLPAVLVIYHETFRQNQAVHFGMQKKIKKINALIQTKVRLASVQTKSMNNISVNSLKES